MSENHKLTVMNTEYSFEDASKLDKYSVKTTCVLTFKIKSKKIKFLINQLPKKYFEQLPYYVQREITYANSSPIYIKVIGCSYCNKEDTFDKNTGRKIAYSRAFIKAYKQYEKILSLIEDNCSALMDKLLENKVRCYKIWNNEDYRLKDVIKRESIK